MTTRKPRVDRFGWSAEQLRQLQVKVPEDPAARAEARRALRVLIQDRKAGYARAMRALRKRAKQGPKQ